MANQDNTDYTKPKPGPSENNEDYANSKKKGDVDYVLAPPKPKKPSQPNPPAQPAGPKQPDPDYSGGKPKGQK